jgi:L-rhamnose isomerase/sugar isomerase
MHRDRQAIGSTDLTVWVGDGTNFPGQQDLARSLDRYLDAAAQIYSALPDDWRMLLEHKMFEPAFYSTVISDWGSSILAAQTLGDKCKCLVDLGHHAPNVNIEQIVARLHRFGKLGGFHFNDSKYGDDDLDRLDQPAPACSWCSTNWPRRTEPARWFQPVLHDRPVAQCDRPD